MPVPLKNEKKQDFIDRCIPIVIEDKTAKDGSQANAICNSIWDESKKKKESAMYIKIDQMERRCLPTSELRIDGTEGAPKITGYAAVFNTWADIGGWFRESIKPGAFAKTIKENDVRALMNHNENYVLGRNKAGTLKLREDSKGLAVEIDPVPATWANDLMKSMRRGDVNQMSFGFQVNKAENNFETDERILTDVTLFDVSVVTFPAYPTTSAQVRSLFMEHRITGDVSLNSVGKSHAASLIGSGKVDKTSSWSFSGEDGNKILGDPPKWGEYSKWFLGIEAGADKGTKQAYHYPFGKDGKVYRSGIVAIRQRDGQQGATGIFDAAGALLKEIDGSSNSLENWEILEAIFIKINRGESLTPDEQRKIMSYCPDLTVPPKLELIEIKSVENENPKKDRISQLLIRAEMVAPSN